MIHNKRRVIVDFDMTRVVDLFDSSFYILRYVSGDEITLIVAEYLKRVILKLR